MNEDEQYLQAAWKIREDPELPDELAPKLDKLLKAAADAEGDARSTAVDELITGLRDNNWARERLDDLTPDSERLAPDWTDGLLAGDPTPAPYYWPDGLQPGKNEDRSGPVRSGLIDFKCQAPNCGFANKLAYRPPEDDMPQCQNPGQPLHALVL